MAMEVAEVFTALADPRRRQVVQLLGTRPMPVWPPHGAAPLATCQKYLLDGVDHVIMDPRSEEQVRAILPLVRARSAMHASAS